MSDRTDDREKLKAIGLDMVNKVYRAFSKEPLTKFMPGITDEDTDCVIQALEDASGSSLSWGEFDGEKHWLSIWGELTATQPAQDKIAAAWETETRIDGDMSEVEIPPLLAEFAARIALEGEYPELVKE